MPAASSGSKLQSSGRPALSIAYLSPDRLKPDPENARRHSARQIRQIADSIATFGFNVPILVDGDLNVIAGHGRLQAARRLRWSEVPTIQLERLSETQRRAFAIADNRLTEVAAWDDRLLAEQLLKLTSVALDFDIETIGFDISEIDLRIESLSAITTSASEPAIPDVRGPAVTRVGELWLLGRHRVLCGDAREAAAHAELMGTERAAAAFSDPPCDAAIDGAGSGLGRAPRRECATAAGETTSEAAFAEFLAVTFERMKASSHPGSPAFICMDWRRLVELLAAAESASLDMLDLCVWAKPNAGRGSLYRSQHELVFVFKLGTGPDRDDVQLGACGRKRSNLWAYAAAPGFGRTGEEGRLAALRPTVKPTAMIADAILDVTRRGDIVVDPFLGGGATLMACERTGRRCCGIELDPLSCDVIVRRWQAHTGGSARLAGAGDRFDDVSTARGRAAADEEAAP